jgi:predicted nucleic acid-binding protein
MVIFDTNILIELYRGNESVKRNVLQIKSSVFYISSITTAEFLVGARDKAEFNRISKQLDKHTQIPIDIAVNDIFINLFTQFSLSHRPGIADTLIAATALHYKLPLFTLNKKHFQYFPNIELI